MRARAVPALSGLHGIIRCQGGAGPALRKERVPARRGAELVPDALMTSQGFGEYIRREYELAREAAKLAGLTPT